ncbi:hypothetical protein [Sulfitobacter sp. W074]|uniref:hypothetical protein n=1 Tax=Sulfitobacter sp. W074 TaxID=2867026 RepID=UPI0021A8472C|nr:hypothetical protein [Sulfitobacter sp. W074]UWR38370.1 hypothetical protein K3762_04885 [Sulfitobacter sp. W074]
MTKTVANIRMQMIMPGFSAMMLNTRKIVRHLRKAGADIYFDNRTVPTGNEELLDEVLFDMASILHFSAERVYIASLSIYNGQHNTTLPEHEDTIRGAKAQAAVASLMIRKVGSEADERARLERRLDDLIKELSDHAAICNGSRENLPEKFFTCDCCGETYDRTKHHCLCEGDSGDCLSCTLNGFHDELVEG